MNRLDLIIDALSVAQNSVWSKLNEQALAAARELQALKPKHQFEYTSYGVMVDENGKLSIGGLPKREWVGLTGDEKNNCLVEADPCEALATPEAQELMREVEAKLKEKNT